MKKTLKQIAEIVGGKIEGGDTGITGVSNIITAAPGDITLAAKMKYEVLIPNTKASAVVVRKECVIKNPSVSLLRVESPMEAFNRIAEMFAPEEPRFEPGIHPSAVIAESVTVDGTAHIGALCVVEENAVVGPDAILMPQVYIGRDVALGSGCRIYPGAVVLERCRLGKRVIVHSGAVIGADGFGYSRDENGRPVKIPQQGWVEIEDDVELGANSTIDRARFGRTLIKKDAKLDNLVHIAHNCSVGRGTAISAQVGISGSVDIGDNVLFGGQSGAKDNISIGAGAIITARAGLTHNIPPAAVMCGFPDMPQDKFKKIVRLQMKLPQLFEKIKLLEKRLEKIDGFSEDN